MADAAKINAAKYGHRVLRRDYSDFGGEKDGAPTDYDNADLIMTQGTSIPNPHLDVETDEKGRPSAKQPGFFQKSWEAIREHYTGKEPDEEAGLYDFIKETFIGGRSVGLNPIDFDPPEDGLPAALTPHRAIKKVISSNLEEKGFSEKESDQIGRASTYAASTVNEEIVKANKALVNDEEVPEDNQIVDVKEGYDEEGNLVQYVKKRGSDKFVPKETIIRERANKLLNNMQLITPTVVQSEKGNVEETKEKALINQKQAWNRNAYKVGATGLEGPKKASQLLMDAANDVSGVSRYFDSDDPKNIQQVFDKGLAGLAGKVKSDSPLFPSSWAVKVGSGEDASTVYIETGETEKIRNSRKFDINKSKYSLEPVTIKTPSKDEENASKKLETIQRILGSDVDYDEEYTFEPTPQFDSEGNYKRTNFKRQ
jgi:hypothetical protein